LKLKDCIYFLSARLSRKLKKDFDKKLEPFGLTASCWCVLMVLFENGSLTQKEIADILFVETPTITKMLDNLSKRGFVVRTPHANDRRAFTIQLTKKALSMKNKILTIGDNFMCSVKSNISDSDMNSVKTLLKVFLKHKVRIHFNTTYPTIKF